MDKHTPLPWAEYGNHGIVGAQAILVVPFNGFENSHDRDLVLKAVNSHASLTEAVRVLTEALENIAQDCEADYPPSHGAIKYAARAALTTAKELTK